VVYENFNYNFLSYSRERKCNFIFLTANGNGMIAEWSASGPISHVVPTVTANLRNTDITAPNVATTFVHHKNTE
jgi:hypothetical protein